MTEKYVESARGRTYYWISPGGDPGAKTLVFLHGLTANHHLFDQQVGAFSGRHTILLWDAPAHGRSRPYTAFSYANLAEELKRILDREGIRKAVLIGQSAGGFTAPSFIKAYGGMAEGFLAIGTCPYDPGYYSRSDFFWLRQTEWMARLFPDALLRKTMAGMCAVSDRGRENMMGMLQDYGKKELCHLMYLGFAGFISEVCAFQMPCPVWLLVGDRDRTGKVRTYNERWHEKEEHPLYIIRNAAHNANDDAPEAVNEIIASFLQTL